MLLIFFRKLIVAALFAAAVAVTAVAALKTSDLTCDVLSQVVSQDACLSTALNAYFGLEGSTELACRLYDPNNQWYLYVDKKTSGTSSSNVGQIASAINKHPNYDGANLAAKWSGNRFLLASAGSDQAACKDATASLRQLVTESCETNTATGAVSCAITPNSGQSSPEEDCKAYAADMMMSYKPTGCSGSTCAPLGCYVYTDSNDKQSVWWNDGKAGLCTPSKECVACSGHGTLRRRTSVDDCFAWTCSGHGTCTDGVNGFTCDCEAGWAGTRCETSVNDCAANACASNGACIDGDKKFCCAGDMKGCGADERFAVGFGASGSPCTAMCTACPAGAAAFPGSNHRMEACYEALLGDGALRYGLISTLTGHSSWVYSVAWSPDGSKIASGSWDDSVKIWNAAAGTIIATLTGHSDWVRSVAWSPDGSKIASGSDDDSVKIWNAAAGTIIATLTGHTDKVRSVAWSPDGSKIASGSYDNSVKIWNAAAGTIIATLTGHSDAVWSVAWSPDGSKIASGSSDRSVKIWNAAAGTIIATLTGHSEDVYSVAWSPDGSKIASGSGDDSVKIWNAAAGTIIATLTGHSEYVYSVAWSPDGSKIASGSFDDSVKIWDAAAGTSIATLTGHSDDVESVAWSPDGSKIASGSDDESVKIMDSAPMCVGKGLYLNVANNECTRCPAYTYNAFDVHRETACTEVPPCNPGSRFVAAASPAEESGTCEPCGKDTYISTPNHRINTCLDQPTCNRGDQISSYSVIAKQTCTTLNECLETVQHKTANTYCKTNLAGHAKFDKLRDAQLVCAADEACTGVADGSCNGGPYTLCATITSSTQGACTWQKDDFKQKTCSGRGMCKDGINEYICTCDDGFGGADCERSTVYCSEGQAYSRLENTCSLCEHGTTYMNETKHQNENCIPQVTCGAGEKISEYVATSAQTCTNCTNSTYQDRVGHREESCKAQPTCNPGLVLNYTGSTTEASGCIALSVQSQDQEELNNSNTIVIGAAAGGFVLLLGILIFIVVFVRRRAAAKRAEDALNEAREHLGIPGDYQETLPSTNEHALSSVTISNAAFAGVVLADSVSGWGDDSSTDDSAAAAPPLPPMSPAVLATAAAIKPSKFVAPANTLELGERTWAGIGLTKMLGVDTETYVNLSEGKAIKKIVSEFKKSGAKVDLDAKSKSYDPVSDLARVNGIINGTYFNPEDKTKTPLASLAEIMATMDVLRLKKHGLKSHHVLAIRVYTSKCYRSINKPMRAKPYPQLPHPFVATVHYITEGLKIIRNAQGAEKEESNEEIVFWRGMENVGIAKDFKSGTEMSCMSTTESAKVAMGFANSKGFIFRVVCSSFMSEGADIANLSVYPWEKEVLYPPLTYLKIDPSQQPSVHDQRAIDAMTSRKIKVVTVRPIYPDS